MGFLMIYHSNDTVKVESIAPPIDIKALHQLPFSSTT
jgi:hypothetical protein